MLDTQRGRKKWLLAIIVLITLLPLITFKYYNFINSNVNDLLAVCGLHCELQGLNWAVPMGISFFTFQALAYVWDVWYGRTKSIKSFTEYALFISFFPQITSGPISRANELIPQIRNMRSFDYSMAVRGLKSILWGMFLKVVIADRLGVFVDATYQNWQYFCGVANLSASLAYTLQIYCDFAGYTLLAIGIGRLLGFELPQNFNRPYFSVSVTDFWRRWHMSLSRWLKDYIYIPLGGSRCSKVRNYYNIFITFLVSGIWHGASWTFILWGVLHGLFQIIEKWLGYGKSEAKGVTRLVRIAITFFLVNLAWIFFRMPTITDACGVITSIFTLGTGSGASLSTSDFAIYTLGLSILAFKEVREEFFPNTIKVLETNKVVRMAIYVALMCIILCCGALDCGSFIYVNF